MQKRCESRFRSHFRYFRLQFGHCRLASCKIKKQCVIHTCLGASCSMRPVISDNNVTLHVWVLTAPWGQYALRRMTICMTNELL